MLIAETKAEMLDALGFVTLLHWSILTLGATGLCSVSAETVSEGGVSLSCAVLFCTGCSTAMQKRTTGSCCG